MKTKIHINYHRQKYSPGTKASGIIRFVQIFVEVTCGGASNKNGVIEVH